MSVRFNANSVASAVPSSPEPNRSGSAVVKNASTPAKNTFIWMFSSATSKSNQLKPASGGATEEAVYAIHQRVVAESHRRSSEPKVS